MVCILSADTRVLWMVHAPSLDDDDEEEEEGLARDASGKCAA